MEYHEAADFLFDLRRYSPRTGVEETRRLLEHLGTPEADLRVVQVAGSNGKGSTARLTECVLREAGLDVGLFTSPHLEDLRERVLIDGRPVTKRAVCEYVEAIEDYAVAAGADGASPTFFEAVTALALWSFDRAGVDVAVLEVGIGGRYDATSAVAPDAAAVTNVTLEHTEVLGDTLPEIARDKAAVAPEDAPLVTAADGAALEAVRTMADEVLRVGTGSDDGPGGADPGDDDAGGGGEPTDEGPDDGQHGGQDPGSAAVDDRPGPPDVLVTDLGREGLEQTLRLAGDGWDVETRIPLLGGHQAQNAGVATALARQVADVSGSAIERGLRSAHWPGRFEVMDRSPLVVLDGAHNPGGCACLAETLSTFAYDDLHLVVGAMSDKDHAGMVAALPAADRAYACAPDLDRAEEAAIIAAAFRSDDRTGDVRECGAVAEAVSAAVEAADDGDAVVVAGSLYTVAEARRRWSRVAVPTRVPDLETAGERLSAADVSAPAVDRSRGAAVHRVVRTRVRPDHVRTLREELRSIGGECAVSALVAHDEELADVVLMGTVSEFDRLAASLDDRSDGLARVGHQLRATVGIGGGSGEPVGPGHHGGPRTTGEPGGMEAPGRTDPAVSGADTARYPWTDRTAVMGILNVTPDSFHDGGRYEAVEDAVDRAEHMVAEGADVVDVGGESTRPGATPVDAADEIDRVVPVVEAAAELDALVSVDTRKADVARAALEAGADVLNDVSGLADPEMRLVAAEHDVPVVVMHSVETPVDPDRRVEYDDVVTDVLRALRERVLLAERAGLDSSQILVDPGLGFGKTSTESFELLGRIGEFRALGCPVLVGHSRKSMFERVGSETAEDRLAATVAASTPAADRGADVLRVHDVAEAVAAVNTVDASNDPGGFDGRSSFDGG